jgi:hypothetical protein
LTADRRAVSLSLHHLRVQPPHQPPQVLLLRTPNQMVPIKACLAVLPILTVFGATTEAGPADTAGHNARRSACHLIWSYSLSTSPGQYVFRCAGSCDDAAYPNCNLTQSIGSGGSRTLSCLCYDSSNHDPQVPAWVECLATITIRDGLVVEHDCLNYWCLGDCTAAYEPPAYPNFEPVCPCD